MVIGSPATLGSIEGLIYVVQCMLRSPAKHFKISIDSIGIYICNFHHIKLLHRRFINNTGKICVFSSIELNDFLCEYIIMALNTSELQLVYSISNWRNLFRFFPHNIELKQHFVRRNTFRFRNVIG